MIRRVPLLLTVVAVCCLSLFAAAGQQGSGPDDAMCKQYTKPAIQMAAGETGQTVKLDDLIDKQEQYLGKVVTVEGEMHRIFTDNVFTIEDDDLVRDDDVLIISDVPREQAVSALEQSIEPGKDVRVTGYVHKYDRQELECLYGPLQVESREGHSFTKSPVLIVQKLQVASAQAPQAAPPSDLAAAPEPAGEPVAVAAVVVEERAQAPSPPVEAAPAQRAPAEPAPAVSDQAEPALPNTAGAMPLVALLGLVSVLTAGAIRALHG